MVNADKPLRWKEDIKQSIDFYNNWFLAFAPDTFRTERLRATQKVKEALAITDNFRNIQPDALRQHPAVVQMLRMGTAPPIAQDRLVGLADVGKNLVKSMEQENRLPPRMRKANLDEQLQRISNTIERLADKDIFTWLEDGRDPSEEEIYRASIVVADRLSGAIANPILRNAQEKRQLQTLEKWLNARGYTPVESGSGIKFDSMPPGSYAFRMNVPAYSRDVEETTNIPIDAVIKRRANPDDFPLLIEAKSAGDFTNVNKRRKEEAQKFNQLKNAYGEAVPFILLLCGYFNTSYLGYEAGEGMDWFWEHRIDDLSGFGV
jgi:hypothetical protein